MGSIDFRSEKLIELIQKILDGVVTTPELNLFISYCQAFSKTSLINEIQHGRLNLDQSLSSQHELDDFALDCIADLFARDENEDLFLLRRVFESKLEEFYSTPSSAVPTLRKLIASRVHQSLISLFSRIDQGGWKIWRNLSLVTKRHPDLHEFTYLTNCYLYYDASGGGFETPDKLNPEGKSIPDELISDWLQTSLKEHYGLPQVIANTFLKLQSHSEYSQFIARARLYNLLKEHLNISYLDVGEIEALASNTANPSTQDAVPNQTEVSIALTAYLKGELHAKYVCKGKIEEPLCQEYFAILELYFSDLLSDGFVEKLQQYLELTGTNHLMNGEWLNHRGRLEYLIKLGKNWLREQLDLGEFSTHSKMRVYN